MQEAMNWVWRSSCVSAGEAGILIWKLRERGEREEKKKKTKGRGEETEGGRKEGKVEGKERGGEGRESGELSGHIFRSEPKFIFRIFFFDKDEDQPKKPKFPLLESLIHFIYTYWPPTAPRPCWSLGLQGGHKAALHSQALEKGVRSGRQLFQHSAFFCHAEARNLKSFSESLVARDPDVAFFFFFSCPSHEGQPAWPQNFCCCGSGQRWPWSLYPRGMPWTHQQLLTPTISWLCQTRLQPEDLSSLVRLWESPLET